MVYLFPLYVDIVHVVGLVFEHASRKTLDFAGYVVAVVKDDHVGPGGMGKGAEDTDCQERDNWT
jgi:hypothetical protein